MEQLDDSESLRFLEKVSTMAYTLMNVYPLEEIEALVGQEAVKMMESVRHPHDHKCWRYMGTIVKNERGYEELWPAERIDTDWVVKFVKEDLSNRLVAKNSLVKIKWTKPEMVLRITEVFAQLQAERPELFFP